MLNKKYIILLLFQVLICYSIFDHTQDFKIPSSTYIASRNVDNLYNFYNPSCNGLNKNKFLYSSYGNHFDGILKNQSIYFSINSKTLKKINFSIINSSIDNIYNTTNAWNDNGDGIIDVTEIDYDNITTFDHNTLGFIISKSFSTKPLSEIFNKISPKVSIIEDLMATNEKYKNLPLLLDAQIHYGINSKFSLSTVLSERSFSHSFDLGFVYYPSKFFDSFWIPNIGLLIKDFLPFSYWSTGQVDNRKTLMMIGSSFSFPKEKIVFMGNQLNQNIFYINTDFNLSDLKHPSIGFEYQFRNNNNLVSLQINNSNINRSIGFIIRLKEQFDIAYSFIIPNDNELATSQKIMIGINSDILSDLY